MTGRKGLAHVAGVTAASCRAIRRALAVASICVIGLLIGGCGAAGGLDTSCSDFVSQDEATQLKLSSEWANPSRDGATSQLSDAVAPSDRDRLLAYCRASGHGDHKLGNLETTFVP
jgi:hypothetical protein